MKVKFEDLKREFKRVLISRNVREDLAEMSSGLFAENDLDGVHTHGSLRFPHFISTIDEGKLDVNNVAEKESGFNGYEVWNGNNGMGNINATIAMDRAMELADEYGIGLVALKHTNHCMRGGTYAWQAANKGYVSISWTNSYPLMPMWGGLDNKLGNNPIVFGIPRENSEHIVIDTALSQYSYGKLQQYRLNGEELPVIGGYDEDGNLTKDPAAIEKTKNVLPIGYWKGASLSFALDMVGLMLSGGNSVAKVDAQNKGNFDLVQVFICMDPSKNLNLDEINKDIDFSIEELKKSKLVDESRGIRYPGERVISVREKNLKDGIEINDETWEIIKNL